jgi:hypothetical protein
MNSKIPSTQTDCRLFPLVVACQVSEVASQPAVKSRAMQKAFFFAETARDKGK